MNMDREHGLGSSRPYGAEHLNLNALPGLRFASPWAIVVAPSGSNCGCCLVQGGKQSASATKKVHAITLILMRNNLISDL